MSPTEHDRMRAVEDHYWWYCGLRHQILSMIHPSKEDFALLDAGCGSGGMLAMVAQRFPAAELVGLDLSEHGISLTAERSTGATLVTGNVNHLPFPDSRFDFILSLDVVTHQHVDDQAAFQECYRVLRSGGELIINVAALNFLRGSHDVAVSVDRRYTKPQLATLLQDAGFLIHRLTYWNMTLLPIIALARWRSRKNVAENVGSDFLHLPSGINSALTTLVRFELKVGSIVPLPLGSSLLAHALKP